MIKWQPKPVHQAECIKCGLWMMIPVKDNPTDFTCFRCGRMTSLLEQYKAFDKGCKCKWRDADTYDNDEDGFEICGEARICDECKALKKGFALACQSIADRLTDLNLLEAADMLSQDKYIILFGECKAVVEKAKATGVIKG